MSILNKQSRQSSHCGPAVLCLGEVLTNSQLENLQCYQIQSVQLKSGPYFNMSNLFTKTYNMLYYTTNLYLQ